MYLTYLYLHFGRKKIEPLADAKGSNFCSKIGLVNRFLSHSDMSMTEAYPFATLKVLSCMSIPTVCARKYS